MQSFRSLLFCFFLPLVFGSPFALSGQPTAVLFQRADSLSRHSHTHRSDSIYLYLLNQKDLADPQLVRFRALLGLSKNRLDYFQFEPFEKYIEQADRLLKNRPDLPVFYKANYYSLKGRAAQNRGRLSEVDDYLLLSTEIYKSRPEYWRELVGVYLFHSQTQIRKNNPRQQKLLIDKAFAVLLSKEADAELMGDANLQLARYYRQQNQWEKHLKHAQQAEKNYRQAFGDIHPKLGVAIQSQSHFYDQAGDLNTMLDRLERSQTVFDQLYPEHYARIGQNAGLLSNSYRRLQRYELAHQYIDLAIDRLSRHLQNAKVPVLADMYRRKALIYEGQDSLELAVKYFERSLDIFEVNRGNVRDVSRNYQGLARCYLTLGELEQAEKFNRADFLLLTQNFGADYSLLAQTYLTAGQLKNQSGQLLEAVAQYQLALEKSAPGFKALHWSDLPRAEDFEYIPTAIPTLQAKAQALRQLGRQEEEQLRYQRAAYDTYLLAIDLIDLLRSTYQSEETRQIIQQNGAVMYQQTLETMLVLQKERPGAYWTDSLFSRINQGKSLLLREAILDREARHFAGIPDSILQKEQELRAAISDLQYGFRATEAPLTTGQRKRELAYLKQELADCIAYIREQYPKYYDLKYADRDWQLSSLQEYLSKEQAIVQYFFTTQALVVAILQADQIELKVLPRPDSLDKTIDHFLKALRDIDFIRANKTQADAYLAAYGHELYEALFSGVVAHLGPKINQLIIIPDRRLAAIPFEKLLSSSVRPELPYRDWPWLLKEYRISYAYSADMWQQGEERSKSPSASLRLAAMAPSYAQVGAFTGMEDLLFELPNTRTEVRRIEKIFGGETWVGSSATKETFRKALGQYDVYHLAMHGVIDNEEPLRSYLAFESDENLAAFDKLSVAELYALDLDTRLVVLSACNSGVGQIHQSEGMISLARAFAYSGAASIVMSRWAVADKSTAELMEQFYRQLKKGKAKDEALRQAKLNYLGEVDDPLFSHPYYWGGFVVIGDAQAIFSNPLKKWAWMPIAVLLLWWLARIIYYRIR